MNNACVLLQINLLLQAYISQLKLEGFALVSDMVYVTQVRISATSFTCLYYRCLLVTALMQSAKYSVRTCITVYAK